MGYIGVSKVAVEASRLVGIWAWSAPALSVLFGVHTEVLSMVRYESILFMHMGTVVGSFPIFGVAVHAFVAVNVGMMEHFLSFLRQKIFEGKQEWLRPRQI